MAANGCCCCKRSCCVRFWCQVFGLIKKAIPVVKLQLIGWALFSYVEDDLNIEYCFTNIDHVADKLYPRINETEQAMKLFDRLENLTSQQLTINQSVAMYTIFQTHFNIPMPLPKVILAYLGCLKWYRFSVMTMTTIGFGGVTPKTDVGKLLVIPYALVTIPVMLSFLAYLGSVVSDWTERIMLCVHRLIKGSKPLKYKLLKRCFYLYITIWIASLLLVIEFITNPIYFGGSGYLAWLDAFYFTFVTFSTIGYGDISEPANNTELYTFELVLGLAAFSGLADSMLAAASKLKFGFKKGNLCCCVRYIEDEEPVGNLSNDENVETIEEKIA